MKQGKLLTQQFLELVYVDYNVRVSLLLFRKDSRGFSQQPGAPWSLGTAAGGEILTSQHWTVSPTPSMTSGNASLHSEIVPSATWRLHKALCLWLLLR